MATANIKTEAIKYGKNNVAFSIGMPKPDPKIRANALTLCPTPSTLPCCDGSDQRLNNE